MYGHRNHLEPLESRLLLSANQAEPQPDLEAPDSWFSTLETTKLEFVTGSESEFVGPRRPRGLASRWIVKLEPEAMLEGAGPRAASDPIASSRPLIRPTQGLGHPGMLLVESFADTADVEAYLANHANIAFFERDSMLAGQSAPNDPMFPSMTGLQQIRVQSAWDAFQADDIPVGSADVVVGILDTGIDLTHPDLFLNVWLNQGEIPHELRSSLQDINGDGRITFRDLNHESNSQFVTDSNDNGYIDGADLLEDPKWENGINEDGNDFQDDLVGWDFTNNDNDPSDDHRFSHGTHVAGTIGAVGDNDVAIAGLASRDQ